MPRLRLQPLSAYPFACEIRVRTTDLNYGGHLGNDRLLALVHEARVDFLAAHGWSELDCAGAELIMADAAIVFQAEAFAGDLLRVETAAGAPTRVGFRLFHRLTRPADDTAVALVETGLVCFDYAAGRPVPLPEPVRALCATGPEA
ncbi:MAG: acyl-CoA thioesterase [Candidatus Krumholzibacteriia bacterium]